MLRPSRLRIPLAIASLALASAALELAAQPYPNPYRMVEGWAKLSEAVALRARSAESSSTLTESTFGRSYAVTRVPRSSATSASTRTWTRL